MTIRLSTMVCLAVAWSGTARAHAEEWRAVRLWVAGSDDDAWVVGVSASGGEDFPIIHLWHADRNDIKTPSPAQNRRYLPPVSGELIRVGAEARALHVMFSDLSIREYFPNRRSQLGASWRAQCREGPLAWAGDASEPILWALAATSDLHSNSTQPDDEDDAQDDEPPPGPTGRAPDSGDTPTQAHDRTDETQTAGQGQAQRGRLTLLQTRGGAWRRVPVLAAAAGGEQFWLSARKGELFLFWQTSGDNIMAATLADGWWSEVDLVASLPNLSSGWAGAKTGGPVFIAGLDDGGDRVKLRVYRRDADAWVEGGDARDGTEDLRIDPTVCGVGIAQGKLAVARVASDGTVEFGLGDLGMSPSIRFSTLSSEAPAPPPPQPAWLETMSFGLAIGIVTAVVWTRRKQLATPIALPKGIMLAPVYRRVFATMLDLVPGTVLVVMISVVGKMISLPQPGQLITMEDLMNDPDMQAVALPVGYASILLYGIWCLIWELKIGTTPGKLLLGCRVTAIDGAPLRSRQVIVRNVARVVMCSLGNSGILMTLMVMLFVSRNRQRIGDLLAGTIVISRGSNEQNADSARGGNGPADPNR